LIDERKSFLGTEDIVEDVAYVRVWHCQFPFSVVRSADYRIALRLIPAINRWAIFNKSALRT
jgi:hypothetical protein